MTSDNPYASPVSQAIEEALPDAASHALGRIARATFLAWEKLRLVYVGILAGVTLLLGGLGGPALLSSFSFWANVVEGAIVANLCFFAGPIVETYVTWLGFRAKWLRISMFTLGTLVSCALVFFVVVSELLPTMH